MYSKIGLIVGSGVFGICLFIILSVIYEIVWQWIDDKENDYGPILFYTKQLNKYLKLDIYDGPWEICFAFIGSIILSMIIGMAWPLLLILPIIGIIFLARKMRRLQKKLNKLFSKMEGNDN